MSVPLPETLEDALDEVVQLRLSEARHFVEIDGLDEVIKRLREDNLRIFDQLKTVRRSLEILR